jgi:hypothetical protein
VLEVSYVAAFIAALAAAAAAVVGVGVPAKNCSAAIRRRSTPICCRSSSSNLYNRMFRIVSVLRTCAFECEIEKRK